MELLVHYICDASKTSYFHILMLRANIPKRSENNKVWKFIWGILHIKEDLSCIHLFTFHLSHMCRVDGHWYPFPHIYILQAGDKFITLFFHAERSIEISIKRQCDIDNCQFALQFSLLYKKDCRRLNGASSASDVVIKMNDRINFINEICL